MDDIRVGTTVQLKQGRGVLEGKVLKLDRDENRATIKTNTGRTVTRKLDLISKQ